MELFFSLFFVDTDRLVWIGGVFVQHFKPHDVSFKIRFMCLTWYAYAQQTETPTLKTRLCFDAKAFWQRRVVFMYIKAF